MEKRKKKKTTTDKKNAHSFFFRGKKNSTQKLKTGVDVTKEPIPVLPTVHYNMGKKELFVFFCTFFFHREEREEGRKK